MTNNSSTRVNRKFQKSYKNSIVRRFLDVCDKIDWIVACSYDMGLSNDEIEDFIDVICEYHDIYRYTIDLIYFASEDNDELFDELMIYVYDRLTPKSQERLGDVDGISPTKLLSPDIISCKKLSLIVREIFEDDVLNDTYLFGTLVTNKKKSLRVLLNNLDNDDLEMHLARLHKLLEKCQ